MPSDAQARPIDVLCVTEADADRAVQPVDHPTDASDTDRAVQPVALETDATNNDDDVRSNSSAESNILDDSGAPEDAHADCQETHTAAQPYESHGIDGGNAEAFEEDLNITALEATTSAHDDWLHRGKFLWRMDFHTYIRFTVRKPRPKDLQISDADRAEHVFLFDSHYALAASH